MKDLVKLWKRPSYDGETFTYYLLYTDEHDRRRQKSLRHADYRKAERQRAQLERELRMGDVEPESMRLSWFVEDSMARTGDQIRESTRIDYKSAMRDFIKVVGNKDYQCVKHTHGEVFRQTYLDAGNSPATVAKKLRGLKRLFQLAVERQQLEENPMRYVKAPRSPKNPKIRIYTDDECNRILRAASQIPNASILEWDIMITLALVTAMRKSELLNLTWGDIDFEEHTVFVSPKQDTNETWEWKIKDTDCRLLPLTQDTVQLLVNLQNRRPEGYPYVLVPLERYDYIQENVRKTGRWTLCHARTSVVNSFNTRFDKIPTNAGVKKGTFHDIRRTTITNWFYQGLSIYDVMKLAGHSKFETTYRFYLQVKDGLLDRARKATMHMVSPELLQKCCSTDFRGVNEKGRQT
jgi:integrase